MYRLLTWRSVSSTAFFDGVLQTSARLNSTTAMVICMSALPELCAAHAGRSWWEPSQDQLALSVWRVPLLSIHRSRFRCCPRPASPQRRSTVLWARVHIRALQRPRALQRAAHSHHSSHLVLARASSHLSPDSPARTLRCQRLQPTLQATLLRRLRPSCPR